MCLYISIWCGIYCLFLIANSCNSYTKKHLNELTRKKHFCVHNPKDVLGIRLDNKYCSKNDPSSQAFQQQKRQLFQWDPVQKGYSRPVIVDGKELSLVTLAVQPKLFLIENFLNPVECDEMISRGKSNGLKDSQLYMDEFVLQQNEEVYDRTKIELLKFESWDTNQDRKITMDEMIKTCETALALYINQTYVTAMFVYKEWSHFEDGILTQQEFDEIGAEEIFLYLSKLREFHPRFRDRYSQNTWLEHNNSNRNDAFTERMFDRLHVLTKVPSSILNLAAEITIVKYGEYGHYNAHYDSDHSPRPCHEMAFKDRFSRLCRYISILIFLNEVEEGGETAFPIADKPFGEEELRQNPDLMYLTKYCKNASLVVKPKQGRALFWYNHLVENGMMGALDYYSLHGGCPILSGEKWIAVIWLRMSNIPW